MLARICKCFLILFTLLCINFILQVNLSLQIKAGIATGVPWRSWATGWNTDFCCFGEPNVRLTLLTTHGKAGMQHQ